MNIPGFDEFELDIEAAFRRDLPPFLEQITAAPLIPQNITAIPPNKNGVYLLIENDVVRYVGKTDSKAGFHNRLYRHAIHIQHRKNLDPDTISFKAVAIPVFKNADIEGMLIEHFKASWNNSGFGSNDPGKQRDTQKPADFDMNHPIDVDIPLNFISKGSINCRSLLNKLASQLPYTFRFEKKKRQNDLNIVVNIPRDRMTMRDIMRLLINSLPRHTWQATVLHGRVILYPENRQYEYYQSVIRSDNI